MEKSTKYLAIAKVVHQQNKAYCEVIGDLTQVDWDEAPAWQKESAFDGIRKIDEGIITQPSDSHQSWYDHKKAEGWIFGPIKDADLKEHPCMVPFESLEPEQTVKDILFFNTTVALLKLEEAFALK